MTATDPPPVIKLSGKALHDAVRLQELFALFRGRPLIVVHGGGVEVDDLLAKVGVASTRLDGLRVSTPEAMPYISAALCGICNKQLQALATGCGCRALGLTATDGGSVRLQPCAPQYGRVASAVPGDRTFTRQLLDQGYLPIFCSIGMDEQGRLWNINADDVAAALAALFETRLYFISDVRGVLDQNREIILHLDRQLAARLIAGGIITEGMRVKVEMALSAARLTGRGVTIAALDDPDLHDGLASGRAFGTTCEPD